MALTYQPPPDWMIKEYMERKHPVAEAAEGAQGLLGTYAALQGQQQTQQLAQEDRDIKLALLNKSGGTNAMDSLNAIRKARGLPPLTIPSTDQAVASPMAAPTISPGMEPNFQPASGGPAQAVSPGGTPILSFWGSSMGGQGSAVPGGPTPPTGKPTHPEVGSDPAIQEFEQMGSQAYRQKYGDDGLTKVKQALDIQKGMQDKTKGPRKTMTKAQALAQGTYDESKEYIVEPPDPSKSETREERLGGSLRDKLIASKPYERFILLKASADNIENAAKDPGAYGDLGALFDYMRALDPTSVVREGEQDTFRKTGSFTEGMANAMNKLVNGESITEDQRKELVKYTKRRLKVAHGLYRTHADTTLRQSNRLGIDPLEVDPYYDYKVDEGVQTSTMTYSDPGKEARFQKYKAKSGQR